jgi:chromate transporter
MMEDEFVKRKQWIAHEHFLDMLGVTNLIPGPNSTQMAIHIGYVKGGWKGLIVAGACFIVPAVAITLVFAYGYVAYGSTPSFAPFIAGIRAAVITVILGAVYRLGKPMLKNRFMVVTGLSVAVCSLFGLDTIALLFGAGIAGMLWNNRNRILNITEKEVLSSFAGALAFVMIVTTGAAAGIANDATTTSLGLYFLKIGSVLYGSGYVLVAFLQAGLVDAHHWLTQSQLLDAVAIGQFTPGPVLSTATFIGYVILGLPGAAVATLGIFLPSFIFVAAVGPFIPKLRKSPAMKGFLDGVNAAALGLMLAVCYTLGSTVLTNTSAWIIFILAAIAVFIRNINTMWLMLGSAAAGWLLSVFLK